jgi:ribosomal protein S18 acetylase RimI-like enzyme
MSRRHEHGRSVDRDLGTTNFHIRSAEQDDLVELGSLDRSIFGRLAYPGFVLRQLFDVHRDCWLVVDHPAGLLGYSLGVPTTDRKIGWLLGLAVRTEYWRRGYGRALTVASVQLLRGTGVGRVCLTVEPGNIAAISLYHEVGFTLDERRDDYFGPGEHRDLMVMDL